MSACAAVQDQLPELALGVLDGVERAAVLDHLETCSRCRTVAGTHAATADALALLAPEAEPPSGFVARTQDRLRREQGRERRRRWSRQQILAVAAAAALLVIATLATVRIVDASGGSNVAAGRVHEAAMLGGSGASAHPVGRAYATDTSGEGFVFLSVDYGLGSGRYSVDVVGDREVVRVGTMSVDDGQGEWAGPSGLRDGPPRRVRLVDAHGTTVCVARFGETT